MERRMVLYDSRDEMLKGVRNMTIDQWAVEVISSMPTDSYRVQFSRQDRQSGADTLAYTKAQVRADRR